MALLSKRRGRIELIGEILKAVSEAGGPIRAAEITYQVKLGWSHLGPLIEGMIKADLLTKEKIFYGITTEGDQMLKWFKPLMSRIRFLHKKTLLLQIGGNKE